MDQRLRALVAYHGADPQVLARQHRVVQLLETARQRKAECEARRAPPGA